eukprot:6217098-Prymnesium_polylepis.1
MKGPLPTSVGSRHCRRHYRRISPLSMLTLAAATVVAARPCIGPRTFSEARERLWTESPQWRYTRPGMAMVNWSTHVNGTIVPPDNI